jgi:hypothetical protein
MTVNNFHLTTVANCVSGKSFFFVQERIKQLLGFSGVYSHRDSVGGFPCSDGAAAPDMLLHS